MSNFEKNKRIAESYRQTKLKRKSQLCKVFDLKIDKSRLNAAQSEYLKMMFVEAKWCYNYILSKSESYENIFKFDYRDLLHITHKDKNKNDVGVEIRYLKSSLKRDLISSIQSSIKGLSTKKKKGLKVGKLKFKSEYNSLELKQYGVVYQIDKDHSKVKIQGIKGWIKVNGTDQLSKWQTLEFANAKLLKKNDDYHLKVTCFIDKEEINYYKSNDYKNEIIGIDFGCMTSLTFSDGTRVNVHVEETDRLKKLQHKLQKKQKGSNNRNKLKKKIRKEYEKISNKKNDLANKIVHKILKENKKVIIQDEQIKSWHANGHGKKVHHSVLGRVKEKLVRSDQVEVLSKWIPTTKLCISCGRKIELKQSDRIFRCPCGIVEDRDIHAAKNMIWFHENIIGVGRTEFKLVDFKNELLKRFSDRRLEGLKQEDAWSSAKH